MSRSNLLHQLVSTMEQFEIIDAHEHLSPEYTRISRNVDVFTFFSWYTLDDLQVAGMSNANYLATQNCDLPLDYRWKLIEPYWQQIRWSSYARAILISAKKFCGADDITEKNLPEISERLAANNTPGLYQRILGDACKIRTALTQCYRTDVGKPLLTPIMPLVAEMETWEKASMPLIADWQGNRRLFDPAISIRSLDDLLDANRSYIKQVKSEGAVGLKTGASPYKEPNRQVAHECFEDLKRGVVSSLPGINPLRDYVIDEMIRFAGEQNLVVAVHTGYWGDFRNTSPLHMIPIVQRHPSVRFDFYHLGYPWMRESLNMGKIFANVWLNFCWTHIISQHFATEALDEAIDMVPMNKIIGFGADYGVIVEKVYGHLVMARENIARVLARRIEKGQMDMEQALMLARKWLYDNPKELYHLRF